MSCGQQGIARLHFFPCLCRLRTDRCIRHRGQVTDLLSQAHTCVWAYGRLSGFLFGGGGPCTALSLGLRSEGLESQFGWGPGHPGQEGDGLVLLVPWVQAGRVFLGYPSGGINSRIVGQSGTACFVSSTVVRTERWKMEWKKEL